MKTWKRKIRTPSAAVCHTKSKESWMMISFPDLADRRAVGSSTRQIWEGDHHSAFFWLRVTHSSRWCTVLSFSCSSPTVLHPALLSVRREWFLSVVLWKRYKNFLESACTTGVILYPCLHDGYSGSYSDWPGFIWDVRFPSPSWAQLTTNTLLKFTLKISNVFGTWDMGVKVPVKNDPTIIK